MTKVYRILPVFGVFCSLSPTFSSQLICRMSSRSSLRPKATRKHCDNGDAIFRLFDKMTLMSLWVFSATGLTSMVLVPIMVAIFWKGRRPKLAGTLSCLVGLVSTIGFYLFIFWIGVENETYGTYIWSFSIGDSSYSIWQEYALYFTLPTSLLGFLVGSLVGNDPQPPSKEASA